MVRIIVSLFQQIKQAGIRRVVVDAVGDRVNAASDPKRRAQAARHASSKVIRRFIGAQQCKRTQSATVAQRPQVASQHTEPTSHVRMPQA
jgi:hypothetical protein